MTRDALSVVDQVAGASALGGRSDTMPEASLAALLLADSRLPIGGYTVSGGLEPALLGGMPAHDVPAYLVMRLATVARVEAGTAVVAAHAVRLSGGAASAGDDVGTAGAGAADRAMWAGCATRRENAAHSANHEEPEEPAHPGKRGEPWGLAQPGKRDDPENHDEPERPARSGNPAWSVNLVSADDSLTAEDVVWAWAARNPVAAVRDSSIAQGRAMLRLVRRLGPDGPAVRWLADLPRTLTARAVVLGAFAGELGLDGESVARVVGYDDVQSVTAAALKLVPLDPVDAVGWTLDSAPALEALVTACAPLTRPCDIPAHSAPQLEAWHTAHAVTERKLFRV